MGLPFGLINRTRTDMVQLFVEVVYGLTALKRNKERRSLRLESRNFLRFFLHAYSN